MLDEQVYWPAASGPFRVAGEGWHWAADHMAQHYCARLSARQRRWIDRHFFDLYSLLYSTAHLGESTAGIHWRFDGGRKVFRETAPFTIYHAQSPQGMVMSNFIYGVHGRALVQVDFVRHGAHRSGHWHPLVPGTLCHFEHYEWDTCPILWQLVPRQIGPLHTELGR